MRSTETKSIAGHLTATNLFGFQTVEQLPEQEKAKTENHIMAIYPALNDDAFAKTMDNYRKYVSEYNFSVLEENEQICKHNSNTQIYKKNNLLTEIEKEYIKFFPKRYKALSHREYNSEIDNLPVEQGRLLIKKKIQTIKYATEQIFQNMLHLYNTQLMKRNTEYIRLSVRTPRQVQELDINSYFVTQLKRNNIASLDICSKTVRNHRQRLEEAGIFSYSIFAGHTKGVKVAINPEILVVFDLQTNKIATVENQHFTPDGKKIFPDNNDTTRTIQSNIRIDKDATQSFVDKEFPTVTPSLQYKNTFYRNTGSNEENLTAGAPLENIKIEKTLSEKLRDCIVHPQELAIDLANGLYINYIPIDIRLLQKEAYSGTLTRSEYRELIIQDFFKNAAKLYRDSNVYPGSWKNALNLWLKSKFVTYNGTEFNKTNIADDIQQLRWRLERARKWFAQTGISTLYPSNYFDPTRKTSKEIGFEYTKKAWERHLKYLETEPSKQRKLQRNAELRQKQINHSKKYENEVRRFLKGKIELPQLIDYVQNNLPQEFYRMLPDTLKRMQTTFKS